MPQTGIGQRTSKKRDAILAAVRSTKCHPSAEWVYEQLKTEYPDLSLGTVYRNLSAFKEAGLIQSVGVVQSHERFDGRLDKHAHFICERCGMVKDIEQPRNLFVAYPAGAKVHSYDVTVMGLCPDCNQESGEQKGRH